MEEGWWLGGGGGGGGGRMGEKLVIATNSIPIGSDHKYALQPRFVLFFKLRHHTVQSAKVPKHDMSGSFLAPLTLTAQHNVNII